MLSLPHSSDASLKILGKRVHWQHIGQVCWRLLLLINHRCFRRLTSCLRPRISSGREGQSESTSIAPAAMDEPHRERGLHVFRILAPLHQRAPKTRTEQDFKSSLIISSSKRRSRSQCAGPAHAATPELLEGCLFSVHGVTSETPFGQDVGSVWSIAEENKGSLRQVNEARRQLCAKLHQYSPEVWLRCTAVQDSGTLQQTGGEHHPPWPGLLRDRPVKNKTNAGEDGTSGRLVTLLHYRRRARRAQHRTC
ncbi:hypothetical protein PFLUV_G00164060 [Perca fluviatilis]|uniref:Uncharacterized protein n=1 Tax=Perca fluviatilis TaxID=8168 RepID=A0A6A5EQ19_PERFL|nr:hypothetical protein PFLUV_G00164060 [Perca fluviatilis]